MGQERRIILFSGTVQGVGFRYTSVQVARGYDVTGYVRNCADGRVECVAEGSAAELDSFFGDLGDAMRGYIRDQSEQKVRWTGEFRSFGVRS